MKAFGPFCMKVISGFFLITIYCALSLSPLNAAGQTPADFQRISGLFLKYYNANNADSLFALFSPEVKKALPSDKTGELLGSLHAQLGLWKTLGLTRQSRHYALYKAGFEHSLITLSLALDSNEQINGFHFLPYKEDSSAGAHDGETLSLKTATGTLVGTLVVPADQKKVPVVLIIAGSGPTDRDGNSPNMGLHSDMYKLLADSLASHGIASFRYDKRGVGASAGAMTSKADLTFDDYIADAAGWIELLRKDPRFSRTVVLGHSEGSLVGMVAAREAKADAYISAAGAGDRIDKVLLPQIEVQSAGLADSARRLFDSLAEGLAVHVASGPLLVLFRPSIQRYMISWMKYDPRNEIKKLTVPILILQGTADLQVTIADAEKLKAARPDAILNLIPGMNHIFRDAGAGADRAANLATYSNPSLPLDATLVGDIVSFINR
ncbi:MAG TPA: alpha/beta fold hydrolase [Puia sp.]|nr:alpha/beta fold hydrolase [Puia sp.]